MTPIPVRGYDLTKFGAKVVSKQAIPPGSVVVLDLPAYQLTGVGHVRHCAQRRYRFAVGMEFRNPLMRSYTGKWQFSVVQQL